MVAVKMNKTYIGVILAGSMVATSLFAELREEDKSASTRAVMENGWVEAGSSYKKPSDDVLRQQLTRLQYKITQEDGTERPFSNEYWDNKKAGIYVDIVSGEPLFSSTHKYKSGTGWPSFYQPIKSNVLTTRADKKLFYTRTELRSKLADSHLGHVFDDGPAPTGLRYCINSASLRFIPREKLEEEGYGEFLSLFEK